MKLFSKEKQVAEEALAYLGLIERCVAEAEKTILAYLDGRIEEADAGRIEVGRLESEADESRRTIDDHLFSGAYLPAIRGNVSGIVDSLDRVPNAAESCCKFFLGQRPEVPAELRDLFVTVAKGSFGVMGNLSAVVKLYFGPDGTPDEIRAHAAAVGREESEVDTSEWALTRAIFSSDALDLSRKMHLRQALGRLVNFSDRAEDVAEQIVFVSMTTIV